MLTSVSRREAMRRITTTLALLTSRAARAEEWGEGLGPTPDNTDPEKASPQSGSADDGAAPEAPVCKVTAQSVEGPFYFDPKLERSDITEGEAGSPLDLKISVIDHAQCLPLANARVDVWHANALGHYSGYASQGDSGSVSTKGKTFLRGTQKTSSDGTVEFASVYPGWYKGRAPHIHVKVVIGENLLVTAQMYLPELLSQRIYGEHEPYNTRGGPETLNFQDHFFNTAGGSQGNIIAGISAIGDTITASWTLAVDRSAAVQSEQNGGFLRYLLRLFGK
jgi:protocatechuate 3,4-dioxygenase beta subunit